MAKRRNIRMKLSPEMHGARLPVTFRVEGDPQSKLRARIGAAGGKTPAKTVEYQRLVGTRAAQAMASRLPMRGPLSVEVYCWFCVPKSDTKAERARRLEVSAWHTVKPDADNVFKAVTDAVQGIIYFDDSQVASVTVQKRYLPPPNQLLDYDGYVDVIVTPI